MSSAIVHLLRHGQVHNPDRIVYGRLPEFRLAERGQEMARVAAQSLAQRRDEQGARIVHLAASPLLRTRQTAQPVAEALDLQIHPDERVIEPWNHFEGLHVDAAELAKPVHWPHLIDPRRLERLLVQRGA